MAEELPANTRGRVQRCVGSTCTAVGTFVKNTAYPAAKVCVGSTCSKAGELGSMVGQWTRNTALPATGACVGSACSKAGQLTTNYVLPAAGACASGICSCVGNTCSYGIARVKDVFGFSPTFSNGLTITSTDRGTVDAIIKKGPTVIPVVIEELARKLGALIDDKLMIMEGSSARSVGFYQRLATEDQQLQGLAKGLYILNLANMGRPLESPNVLTVASILLQVGFGTPDNISFDNIIEEGNLRRIRRDLNTGYVAGIAGRTTKLPTPPPGGWFGSQPAASLSSTSEVVVPSTGDNGRSTAVLRPVARRFTNMNTGAKKNMGGGKRNTRRRKIRKHKRRTNRR